MLSIPDPERKLVKFKKARDALCVDAKRSLIKVNFHDVTFYEDKKGGRKRFGIQELHM